MGGGAWEPPTSAGLTLNVFKWGNPECRVLSIHHEFRAWSQTYDDYSALHT